MQTPWGEIGVSDAHCHFFSRRFFETLAGQSGSTAEAVAGKLGWDLPAADPRDLAHTWARELDQHGVRRAALIASVPGDEASVTAAAAECPDRFFAYAMVNPVGGQTELREELDALCLFPAMHRYSVNDSRLEPLLEQAAARGCAVFVHCGVLTVGVRKKLGLASPFDMRYSNPLELHPIALRYPQLRFILPHFGAGYFREALMVTDLCPNIYLDTSSSNSWMRYEGLDLATVFRRALNVAGPGRLLFGTDSSFLPRGWNREVFDIQVKALAGLGTSDTDARGILGGNLERLMARAAR